MTDAAALAFARYFPPAQKPVALPPRSDLDIEVDRMWHRLAHASDPDVVVSLAQRHSALCAQRAAQLQQQGAGSL